jgi:radical SAM superfamily enzyme YgiQ (UPF0313 family)
VPYLTGPLRRAGFNDITFIDAMTEGLSDEELAERMAALQPDVVGTTAITPSIYAAERVLEVAAFTVPNAVRVLGGIHATFMYRQVLTEAPWIDVIVRGEGEEILVALMTAILESRLRNLKGGDRDSVGLFQQRPSQGWGTAQQLNDPQYAAGKFYDALVRVGDRDTMRLTEVAQKVQASAYPNAYAKWETQARELLRGL